MSKLLHHFKHGENIVSMVLFQNTLIVATNEGLYRLREEIVGGRRESVLERIELIRESRDDGRPNAE